MSRKSPFAIAAVALIALSACYFSFTREVVIDLCSSTSVDDSGCRQLLKAAQAVSSEMPSVLAVSHVHRIRIKTAGCPDIVMSNVRVDVLLDERRISMLILSSGNMTFNEAVSEAASLAKSLELPDWHRIAQVSEGDVRRAGRSFELSKTRNGVTLNVGIKGSYDSELPWCVSSAITFLDWER